MSATICTHQFFKKNRIIKGLEHLFSTRTLQELKPFGLEDGVGSWLWSVRIQEGTRSAFKFSCSTMAKGTFSNSQRRHFRGRRGGPCAPEAIISLWQSEGQRLHCTGCSHLERDTRLGARRWGTRVWRHHAVGALPSVNKCPVTSVKLFDGKLRFLSALKEFW